MKKSQIKTSLLVLVAAVSLVGMSACAKKAPADACEKVTLYMNTLIANEVPEAERAAAKASLDAGVATTVAECKNTNMTVATMDCLLGAKSTADFAKCK